MRRRDGDAYRDHDYLHDDDLDDHDNLDYDDGTATYYTECHLTNRLILS